VLETGEPIAQVARELAVDEGTLGNWVTIAQRARDGGDGPLAVAAFIAAQREQYGIPCATACRALQVSSSWFHKWRHGDPSPRHARRIALAAEVARLPPPAPRQPHRQPGTASRPQTAGASARLGEWCLGVGSAVGLPVHEPR
jgi:transposase-like protein